MKTKINLNDVLGIRDDNVGLMEELEFQQWYQIWASRLGLNRDPDDPQHFYDYRSAFKAGAQPDAMGHWPSQFKMEGHPRLILNGIDTRTGQGVR